MHNSPSHTEVSLEEMLLARERRVMIQKELIKANGLPLVSFTLNIPGPVKVYSPIPQAFETGCLQIRKTLDAAGIRVVDQKLLKDKTGYEAFYCADALPEDLKRLAVRLEDEERAGRLYDIDIIRQTGQKVTREELDLPPRTCLICGGPAHACSRSRRHTLEELTARVREILGTMD